MFGFGKKRLKLSVATEGFLAATLDCVKVAFEKVRSQLSQVGVDCSSIEPAELWVEITAAALAVGLQPVKNLQSYELYDVAYQHLLSHIDSHDLPFSEELKRRFVEYSDVWRRADPERGGNMPWDEISIRLIRNIGVKNRIATGPIGILTTSNAIIALSRAFSWGRIFADFKVHA